MADTIKSALFVDYDSFHRSQDDENGDTAERIAQTSAVWVTALEVGQADCAAAGERRAPARADPALLRRSRAPRRAIARR